MNGECTIFANIFSSEPHHISIDHALERIRTGRSQEKIEEIRRTIDKAKANLLKEDLPAVCFSGTFTGRKDEGLIMHSGFIVLDFDGVEDLSVQTTEILQHDFIYAMWLSPRGNGLKVLVKIADGSKHRDHFAALKEIFKDVDRSGVNVSRVCYESYDPSIVINKDAAIFKKVTTVNRVEERQVLQNDEDKFRNILKWLANRNDAFVSGERNLFVFKLASALCRFGVDIDSAQAMILREYPTSNDFTNKEMGKTVRSAFNVNRLLAGTVHFERDIVYDQVRKGELEIAVPEEFTNRLRDIVYAKDVKDQAYSVYKNGYEFAKGVGIPKLDRLFKMRRGENTLLTGHGNYGKTHFKKWYQVLRAVLFDEKFASFSPEEFPIHQYYNDLTEILLGCECTQASPGCPVDAEWKAAYDWIGDHFFYIAPTDLSPTPEYCKQRFLELIFKEKIDGCDIDPFNQMTNDYGRAGGRSDKYLETVLADFMRFAQQNNVYFWIIAHPTKSTKNKEGNYPCPDVYDIADGAMWNNKMNNILVYHRPFMQTAPDDATIEFHTKKIKDQKTVGRRGFEMFDLNRKTRRFEFDQVDYLELALEKKKLYFGMEERVAVSF